MTISQNNNNSQNDNISMTTSQIDSSNEAPNMVVLFDFVLTVHSEIGYNTYNAYLLNNQFLVFINLNVIFAIITNYLYGTSF